MRFSPFQQHTLFPESFNTATGMARSEANSQTGVTDCTIQVRLQKVVLLQMIRRNDVQADSQRRLVNE